MNEEGAEKAKGTKKKCRAPPTYQWEAFIHHNWEVGQGRPPVKAAGPAAAAKPSQLSLKSSFNTKYY